MYKSLFLSITFLLTSCILFSQKKPLDHSVYDYWKSLTGTAISKDGKITGALICPQEGDTTLLIKDNSRNRTLYIERVKSYVLSPDGKWTVGLVSAPYRLLRQARIDKKNTNEMPGDSLLIINNLTFDVKKIPGVKSYKTAKEFDSHVAYSLIPPKDIMSKNDAKKKEIMVLRNILTQREDTFRNVKEYTFSKFGDSFALTIQPDKKDSTSRSSVAYINLKNNTKKIISCENIEYKSLAFDEPGSQLVYLATADTSKLAQKVYDLRYYVAGADSAVILADRNASGLPEDWIFNEYAAPSFSKDCKRILLGAAPAKVPKDTTIVDFEMASLDIWHWQEPLTPPQQLVELKREESRTYAGIVSPGHMNQYIPLATEKMPYTSVADEGNGQFALLWSDRPYQLESQWDISSKQDVWIKDLQTDSLYQLARPLPGRPALSPDGNFTFWWDAGKQHWFALNNRNKLIQNLTRDIPVNFWNEKHDTPSPVESYGIAAWGENDAYVLIYDAFDLWKIDPTGKKKPENVTRHTGRADSITFRYINTDPEKRFIAADDLILLSAFDNVSKEWGYYTLAQKGRNPLKKRALEKFSFSGLEKAKDVDIFVFQKSNFNTSPDLYVTTDYWKTAQKLTDINPQMHGFNWGTAELFSWTSLAGIPLQGILYKPEDFDPAKKYPLMIYFYEKHSDELYRWFAPAPSRSTINIPFFVSRGYIVFTPDIHYTVGHPGKDAYNAVVAGAEALAQNSWVDKKNMAIQGQSWGGYQVAYLVTQTNMFKAAGAGAPVSNMTSAYGGIRWESGRSRQFQYEQTQSRIGSTLKDSLQLYIENSPLFHTDKVETPLLIMHNDKDGAVPWYQGIELFMTLRRLGKPTWLLQYNNEAHNLVQRRNSKDLSIRLQQFFDHYLKGAPAPIWMTRGVPTLQKGKTWGYQFEDIESSAQQLGRDE
ncbi:MAG: prolyl oligopeptidase family serine peptidase [Porphyromonadaceae bacterium]|nr:prolyl oligopeptidase family serine peptidase [Porphyromonadaceae bacterium]